MRLVMLLAAGLLSAAALPAPAAAEADPTRGEAVFRKCAACHTLEANGRNRVGPRLHRLFGRQAGAVGDFRYTAALKNSGLVRDETTLDAFLKDSEAFVPGTKMYGGLAIDRDRADLIAYLRRATAP
jgi:cytochrome c